MNNTLTYRLITALFPSFDYAISNVPRAPGDPWFNMKFAREDYGTDLWLWFGSREVVMSVDRR